MPSKENSLLMKFKYSSLFELMKRISRHWLKRTKAFSAIVNFRSWSGRMLSGSKCRLCMISTLFFRSALASILATKVSPAYTADLLNPPLHQLYCSALDHIVQLLLHQISFNAPCTPGQLSSCTKPSCSMTLYTPSFPLPSYAALARPAASRIILRLCFSQHRNIN